MKHTETYTSATQGTLRTVNFCGEGYLWWDLQIINLINNTFGAGTANTVVCVFGCVVTTDAGQFVLNCQNESIKRK